MMGISIIAKAFTRFHSQRKTGGVQMMDMSPFWEMVQRRGISTYDLEYKYGMNPAETSRLKNNHNFSLRTLDRYCNLFHCRIEDIVVHIDSASEQDGSTVCETVSGRRAGGL